MTPAHLICSTSDDVLIAIRHKGASQQRGGGASQQRGAGAGQQRGAGGQQRGAHGLSQQSFPRSQQQR